MLGMKYALPPMLAAGSGSIVNIASLAGIRVTRYASYAYHAAKAGVVHLSEAAAVLYADRGIRVNVIAPGLTLTPNIARTMPDEVRASLVREFHPSQRMVSPRSEEHTSELQSLMRISYAVFCLTKKTNNTKHMK